MKMSRWAAAASFVAVLALTSAVRAEGKVTVELKHVHLCCDGCVDSVAKILGDIDGVEPTCDKEKKTVTITAKDAATAKKAIQALADGGYHGESDKKEFAIKDDSGVKKGKVEKLTLTGVHNCCRSCCRGIKEALKKVDGVTGDTAEPKKNTFEVTGDFDAAEVVKALNAAGYHVKVKK
jgi:mercuric ion binding protein